MSEIADLTAAGRADLLPGYILSPFTWGMYGQCEQEWEQQLLADAAKASFGLPIPTAEALFGAAITKKTSGMYAHGAPGFDMKANARTSVPFLVWLSLEPKHPQMTRGEVAKMVDALPKSDFYKLRRGVLELMGYSFDPKPLGGTPAPARQPAPVPSSKPSPNEASTPASLPT